jgi:signal transduction histidine kinase
LALQVFVAIGLSIGLVFAGSFVYDLISLTGRVNRLQEDSLRRLAPAIEQYFNDAMVHGVRGHIGMLFQTINSMERGAKVQLIDLAGRDALSGGAKAARTLVGAPPDGTVVLHIPLVSGPACMRCHGLPNRKLGTIRLTAPTEERHALRASLVGSRLAMAAVGALLLAAASLLIVRRLIHIPIAELVVGMRRVAGGSYDGRIGGRFPGEMQNIADEFNAMVGEIARDRREIVDLHRRQLAHLDRLATLGELAANLAHEVRNPLTGLGAALQVLGREAPEGSPRRELVGKMLAQLSRMDKTMGDFLRYARMPEAVRRPFDIGDVIGRAVFLISPRLKSQSVVLDEAVPRGLPALFGDPGQVEQVLLNLLLNAAAAMPSGGRVSVAVGRQGASELQISITDTGAGIPPANLEKVFEPFFTTRDGGSGLGLPLARQIIMGHGGELLLESEPGVGTAVHVRLPVAPGAGEG